MHQSSSHRLYYSPCLAVVVISLVTACSNPSSTSPERPPIATQPSSSAIERTEVTPTASDTCGGIDDKEVREITSLANLNVVASTTVGCEWSEGTANPTSRVAFTWYRGSPIGRERSANAEGGSKVDDASAYPFVRKGFVASSADDSTGTKVCEFASESESNDIFYLWTVHLVQQSTIDACGIAADLMGKTMARVGITNLDISVNDTDVRRYPNVATDCDVATVDLASAIGVDTFDLEPTSIGAVCRWQTIAADRVYATRFWFENGTLQTERDIARDNGFDVRNQKIGGVSSAVITSESTPGACGVVSAALGVVGWWIISPTTESGSCERAIALMERTLSPAP